MPGLPGTRFVQEDLALDGGGGSEESALFALSQAGAGDALPDSHPSRICRKGIVQPAGVATLHATAPLNRKPLKYLHFSMFYLLPNYWGTKSSPTE